MRRRLVIACLLALVACDGTGVVGVQARVQVPEEAGFGAIWVGGEARAVVFIESLGQAPVQVTRIAVDDLNVSLSTSGGRLAGGSRMRVELTWRPTVAGVLAARLSVETDVDEARSLSVRLSGEARTPPACDDGNPCTDDVFDRALGRCTFTAHARACDDGNACTSDDACFSGVCRGRAVTCDDGNVCTRDLCDPATGCYHPPDERVCDDGDPCTSNVCDPNRGCSFPNAPDGTSCGDFACDKANVCVMGTCRTLDVTGSSDGFPCSDGDACTKDDECLAGVCVPGESVRSEPEVTARFETFGGAGSTVGSDGVRFVFADADALRIAVLGVDGALSHVGTLRHRSTVPPVKVAPARFLVASGDELALLDVSDAALPRLVWQKRLSMSGPDATIRAVAAGHQGVAVALGRAEPQHAGILDAKVVWVPLEGADAIAGTPVVLASLPVVYDLDASGLLVAWTDAIRVWLSRLPSSTPDEPPVPEQVGVAARRVSLEGLSLATLENGLARVIDVGAAALPLPEPCEDEPCLTVTALCAGGTPGAFTTCDEAPCREGLFCAPTTVEGCPECQCDDACCTPEVRRICVRPGHAGVPQLVVPAEEGTDLLLSGDVLAWATPAGIRAVTFDETIPTHSSVTLLDEMPADRLERGPGLVLATGALALPLSLVEGIALEPPTPLPPQALRLTGPRHGDVSVIADGFGSRVSLAGRTAVAQLDVVQAGLTSWSLLPTPSSPEQPRLLKGASRWASVESPFSVVGGECAPLETVTGLGTLDSVEICGHFGGPSDLAGTTLWSHTSAEQPPSPESTRSVRAWHLLPLESEPAVDRRDPATPEWLSTALRGSDRGTFGTFIEGLPGRVRVSILRAGQPASAVVGTVEVPREDDLPVHRSSAASDGNLVLVGDAKSAALYDAADPAVEPRASLSFPTRHPVGVEWMAGGRGWLSWQDGQGERLSQVYYDAAGALETDGSVALPGRVRRVYDTGHVGVVTTGSEVLLVAPACR